MPVGYTYITRSATGWVYGGKRESATFDDKYYGSGKVVQQHLAKYGNAELLKCDPVAFYESYGELYEAERQLILELRTLYGDNCKNILDGGDGFTNENMISMWSSTQYREKIIFGIKNSLSTPEARFRNSVLKKKAFSNPEARKRLSDARKKDWSRRKLLMKNKNKSNSVPINKIKSEAMKAAWARRKAAQQQALVNA